MTSGGHGGAGRATTARLNLGVRGTSVLVGAVVLAPSFTALAVNRHEAASQAVIDYHAAYRERGGEFVQPDDLDRTRDLWSWAVGGGILVCLAVLAALTAVLLMARIAFRLSDMGLQRSGTWGLTWGAAIPADEVLGLEFGLGREVRGGALVLRGVWLVTAGVLNREAMVDHAAIFLSNTRGVGLKRLNHLGGHESAVPAGAQSMWLVHSVLLRRNPEFLERLEATSSAVW